MDKTLITIVTFILLASIFLILYLLKSFQKVSYKANDGTIFENNATLDIYETLVEKLNPLFSYENENPQKLLGFDKSFLSKLRSDGFTDLKTLLEYRDQIKNLSDLINN
tara:strand:+ start:78 stop:404 length:327 start_codon:yes stop_codon:yes gene_type:complete